jgi:hypothetical protein
MNQAQRDDEEDLMFDFKHRHNLALLLRGIYLPPVFVIREGREILLWSSISDRTIRLDLSETIATLSEFGNFLCKLLEPSEIPLAALARERWEARTTKTLDLKNSDTFGIEDPIVIELLRRGNNAASYPAVNDSLYIDNETRAAARMTARKITAKDQAVILEKIHTVQPRLTPDLDSASRNVPNAEQFGIRGFEQGYELATWFRSYLELGTGPVNPQKILEDWDVEISTMQIDPAICAVAVWGRQHGPGIILNTVSSARTSGIKGRRATLAHEICHLIYDRERSLPVVDVLGGLGPVFAEKRANAFAAEFLLPRAVAAQAVRNYQEDILKVASSLERKYVVSREIVGHQITNSGETITSQLKIQLQAWVQEKPGIGFVSA